MCKHFSIPKSSLRLVAVGWQRWRATYADDANCCSIWKVDGYALEQMWDPAHKDFAGLVLRQPASAAAAADERGIDTSPQPGVRNSNESLVEVWRSQGCATTFIAKSLRS